MYNEKPKLPQWKADNIRPTNPRPRSPESYANDYPFKGNNGYFTAFRVVVKKPSVQYPKPTIMLGINGGHERVFITFDDPVSLSGLSSWLAEQCLQIQQIMPQLRAEQKTIEDSLQKVEQDTQRIADLRRMMEAIQSDPGGIPIEEVPPGYDQEVDNAGV